MKFNIIDSKSFTFDVKSGMYQITIESKRFFSCCSSTAPRSIFYLFLYDINIFLTYGKFISDMWSDLNLKIEPSNLAEPGHLVDLVDKNDLEELQEFMKRFINLQCF